MIPLGYEKQFFFKKKKYPGEVSGQETARLRTANFLFVLSAASLVRRIIGVKIAWHCRSYIFQKISVKKKFQIQNCVLWRILMSHQKSGFTPLPNKRQRM